MVQSRLKRKISQSYLVEFLLKIRKLDGSNVQDKIWRRLQDCSLSTILPWLGGSLKMFWLMPMGNVPQWEKENTRLEQDVSLEKWDIDMRGFYIYHLFVKSCIFKAFSWIFINMFVLCHSVSFIHSDIKTWNLIS